MSDAPLRLGPQERLLLLKKLTLAAGLPAEGLIPLAQHAIERRFTRDSVLVERGSPVESLLVLAEGRVTAAGRDPQSSAGPDDVVGAMEVIAGAPGHVTVTAATDVVALEIPAETLFEVYEDHFAIFLGTLRSIAAGLLADEAGLLAAVLATPAPEVRATVDAEDLVERVAWLRADPVFARCRLDSLVRFAAELTPFTAAPGTSLWSRGDAATGIVLLLHGEIRCTCESAEFVQGPGASVGVLEAFSQGVRWFAAEAITPLLALRLSIERFIDLLEDDSALARDVLASFAAGALEVQAKAPGD